MSKRKRRGRKESAITVSEDTQELPSVEVEEQALEPQVESEPTVLEEPLAVEELNEEPAETPKRVDEVPPEPFKLLVAVSVLPKGWPYRAIVLDALTKATEGLNYTIQVFKPEIGGYDGALKAHQMIAAASDGYDSVLIVDADVYLTREDLLHLIGNDSDLAYGLVPFHDEPWLVSAGPMFINEHELLGFSSSKLEDLKDKVTLGWVWGGSGCLLVKSKVLQEVPFRADYEYNYGDDILFCNDAQQKGFRAVLDGFVVCTHLPKVKD